MLPKTQSLLRGIVSNNPFSKALKKMYSQSKVTKHKIRDGTRKICVKTTRNSKSKIKSVQILNTGNIMYGIHIWDLPWWGPHIYIYAYIYALYIYHIYNIYDIYIIYAYNI